MSLNRPCIILYLNFISVLILEFLSIIKVLKKKNNFITYIFKNFF